MSGARLSGLEVLAATLMLAGVFIAGDVAVADVNPVLVAAMRFVLAALVLLGALTAVGAGARIDKAGLGLILLCGFTGVFLYNVLFFYGLKLSNVSHGAAIIATIPVMVALIERAWQRTRPPGHQIVGTVVAFLGVLVIVEHATFFGDLSNVTADTPKGDLAFLLAALCFAVYSIIGRRATGRFGAYRATTYNLAAGAVMLAAGSFAFTDPVATLTSAEMTPRFGALIAYMGVFGSVLAFVFYYRGVQAIGAQRTSMFLNMVPVWVVILAALLLDQPITLPVAVGIPTVIVGLLIFQQNPMAIIRHRRHASNAR